MKSKRSFFTPETVTLLVFLTVSVLSLVFMTSLVAQPKALFGRSLSAIAPSLFPTIVLGLMAGMSLLTLLLLKTTGVAEQVIWLSRQQWIRAVVFFAIMILYGLIMDPFGFLISTAIATTLISLQMGARSVLQIAIVAILGPVLLYLAATELLAVSLPELDVIEMLYARMFAL